MNSIGHCEGRHRRGGYEITRFDFLPSLMSEFLVARLREFPHRSKNLSSILLLLDEPVPPELVHVLAEDVSRPERRDEVVELVLLAVAVLLLLRVEPLRRVEATRGALLPLQGPHPQLQRGFAMSKLPVRDSHAFMKRFLLQ